MFVGIAVVVLGCFAYAVDTHAAASEFLDYFPCSEPVQKFCLSNEEFCRIDALSEQNPFFRFSSAQKETDKDVKDLLENNGHTFSVRGLRNQEGQHFIEHVCMLSEPFEKRCLEDFFGKIFRKYQHDKVRYCTDFRSARIMQEGFEGKDIPLFVGRYHNGGNDFKHCWSQDTEEDLFVFLGACGDTFYEAAEFFNQWAEHFLNQIDSSKDKQVVFAFNFCGRRLPGTLDKVDTKKDLIVRQAMEMKLHKLKRRHAGHTAWDDVEKLLEQWWNDAAKRIKDVVSGRYFGRDYIMLPCSPCNVLTHNKPKKHAELYVPFSASQCAVLMAAPSHFSSEARLEMKTRALILFDLLQAQVGIDVRLCNDVNEVGGESCALLYPYTEDNHDDVRAWAELAKGKGRYQRIVGVPCSAEYYQGPWDLIAGAWLRPHVMRENAELVSIADAPDNVCRRRYHL